MTRYIQTHIKEDELADVVADLQAGTEVELDGIDTKGVGCKVYVATVPEGD